MHQRDRSRPPGDPSLMRGGIDGYRIEMAKNENPQRQAGPAQKQTRTQPHLLARQHALRECIHGAEAAAARSNSIINRTWVPGQAQQSQCRTTASTPSCKLVKKRKTAPFY